MAEALESVTELLTPRWAGACVVAAPGPSLELAPLWLVDGRFPIIAVGDAYRLLPRADVLFGTDAIWWEERNGCTEFAGERWSSHGLHPGQPNDKRDIAERFGVRLVQGFPGNRFKLDGTIAYGSNSGFAAINCAINWGATEIFLIGFDMKLKHGKGHFFGNHTGKLNQNEYTQFAKNFKEARQHMPDSITIHQCTPDSHLQCFGYTDPYDLNRL